MRPVLIDCASELTDDVISDVLSLVGPRPADYCVAQWTDLERRIAYDWAIREYLRASDNPVHLRPRPHFVAVACGRARG